MKVLLPFIILLLAINGYSQTDCAKMSVSAKDTVTVTNINPDYDSDPSCVLRTFTGNITGLHYDDDQSDVVSGITIELKNGRREIINFFEDFADNCFAESEKDIWKHRLVKGASVVVTAYGCGAAGRGDLGVNSIQIMSSTKTVKKKVKNNIK